MSPYVGMARKQNGGYNASKVSRGNSEYRIIRNGSGIYLGYYKTTDRLDILFHHKVAAGVGFIISTSFAAGRCPSQRRAKKC